MENVKIKRADLSWEPKMRLSHIGIESVHEGGDVQTRVEFTITDTGDEYIIIGSERVVRIAHPLLEALIAFHREAHPAVEE